MFIVQMVTVQLVSLGQKGRTLNNEIQVELRFDSLIQLQFEKEIFRYKPFSSYPTLDVYNAFT